jgi:phosphoglycerol transferase
VEFARNAAGYVATAALAIAVMIGGLKLWHADLRVPFLYLGDNLLNQLFIQGTLENGWYLENPRLGVPGHQSLHDFPLVETLHFGIIKLLGCLSHDSGLVLNLFSLLPFPLIALSAYFVLRRFHLARLLALVASVLYACLPYHLVRCKGHIFLSAYYLLPLMTLVLLKMYLGRLPFVRVDDQGVTRWRFFTLESIGAVLVCALTGIAGAYYAFFSCYLLLGVGFKAAFRERKGAPLFVSMLLVAVVCAGVGTALAPSLLYNAKHGKNFAVANRNPVESDVYGLNVAEMLMPVANHRVSLLRRIHNRYMAPPRQATGESWSVPLGSLAALGFVWLVGLFLWRRRHRVDRVDDGLAFLAVIAVLLGTVGGVGTLFNAYISAMIRCYNRLTVFIAFFALFGLFFALQRLVGRYVRSRRSFAVYAAGALGLLVVGAYDQCAPWYVPAYAMMKERHSSDVEFGKRMEAVLPEGAMIYQMPYVPFPEHPSVHALTDYDLLRPYFHTRTLRFSYGGMKGREASCWQETLAQRPLAEVVRVLAHAGFSGIYLDRAGFADQGAAVEKQLRALLGVEPLVSPSERQTLFDLTTYAMGLRQRSSEAEWEFHREAALYPVTLTWVDFGPPETANGIGIMRRCGPQGELHLSNPLERPREAVLKVDCSGWTKTPVHLVIGGLVSREVALTAAEQPLELKLRIPPGDHVIRFTCDGPYAPPSVDPIGLVFRLRNLEWRVEE